MSPPNNMENLYNLFLNHLLKPFEWASAKNIGQEGELGDSSRFYFRPDLIQDFGYIGIKPTEVKMVQRVNLLWIGKDKTNITELVE